jgi:pyrroloquinoline quinone biosynthesis protein D
MDHLAADALIPDDARPRLPLAPECIFKADAIAVEFLKRCAGEATLGAIVDELAAAFKAPHERVHADVGKLLSGLAEKKLLEF